MIALQIVPLRWADPDIRKVLVHDEESLPSIRFTGDDNEGFYSVTQAVRYWEVLNLVQMPHYWVTRHCHEIVPCDLPLYNVASLEDGRLFGVYIEHFSSPTDYSDHFVETPLLSLPDVPEDAYDPETHEWAVGDFFMVTSEDVGAGDAIFIAEYGKGPFCVTQLGRDTTYGSGVFSHGMTNQSSSRFWSSSRLWYEDEIRPCPAPEPTTDTQANRTELPCPGSAGGTVTIPSQEAKP